ncbi:24421_t:CDS:2 [Gigaspora rosea]|nr:24421_t:CDS:2 [Gigaspora rosea]
MSSLLNEAMLNNNELGRLLPIDIDNIDEESDMDISDNEIDDALDRIMNTTDGVEAS